MSILNEEISRVIELMGVLSEQTFVCDECRWDGVRTYMVSDDNKQTGDIKLELSLHNHTGSDTDRIEKFNWEGKESEQNKGYREMEGKARNSNRKYKINIEIPELNGFMENEEAEEGHERFGESTPFISKLKK